MVVPTASTEPGAFARDRDLLSSVCHDLRAPLASIVMGIGFLRRVLPADQAAALRVVESLHRSADRMNQLIAAFHDLGRLQAHDLTLSVHPHDMGALAKAAFEDCIREASAQNITGSFELGPGLEEFIASCDRERLAQSLKLLATCALRVITDGGTLALRADVIAGGEIRFEVTARRGGPECRPMRAEPPKPELALAKGLIELHDGRLEQTADSDKLTLAFIFPQQPRASVPTFPDLTEVG